MTDKQPLTGATEIMRGFVGSKNLSNKPCNNGRPRIVFELCAGDTDLQSLKIPTWRRCVGYDYLAVKYSDIKAGDLVKVQGWIKTEIKRDYAGKPIFLPGGVPVTADTIILESLILVKHKKQQYNLFDNLPSGADCTAVEAISR